MEEEIEEQQMMVAPEDTYDINELWNAVCVGNTIKLNEIIEIMGKQEFNPNIKIGKGPQYNDFTLLHWAAYHNQPQIVKILAKYGADFNAETKQGLTPLKVALQKKHTGDIIELLKQENQ